MFRQEWLYGAAQESNLPSLGLPDLTGFEDRAQGICGVGKRMIAQFRSCKVGSDQLSWVPIWVPNLASDCDGAGAAHPLVEQLIEELAPWLVSWRSGLCVSSCAKQLDLIRRRPRWRRSW